ACCVPPDTFFPASYVATLAGVSLPAVSTWSANRTDSCNGYGTRSWRNESKPAIANQYTRADCISKNEIIALMDMTAHMASHFDDAADTFKASARELAAPLAVAAELLFGALANNNK